MRATEDESTSCEKKGNGDSEKAKGRERN